MRQALSDVLFAESGELPRLREFLGNINGLHEYIGEVATFRFVIDANVVIRDLLWLVSKRTNPEARTGLMESIEAGTVIGYVPPKAIEEINEKIPYVAERRKVDRNKLYEAWESYKELLVIESPDDDFIQELRSGRDPDDAEYVALQKKLCSHGIFSYDKDIPAMGGNVIDVSVIGYIKQYSREMAIDLNIKVNGVLITAVGATAVRGFLHLISRIGEKVKALPGWLKIALLVAAAFVVVNKRSRDAILNKLNQYKDLIVAFRPQIIAVLSEIHREHEDTKERASGFLEEVMGLLSDFDKTDDEAEAERLSKPSTGNS